MQCRSEGSALAGACNERLGRLEAVAVQRGEFLSARGEPRKSHVVDELEATAGPCRETPAENRADVGITNRFEHAFIQAADGFERLDVKEPLADVVMRGLALRTSGKDAESAPESLGSVAGIVVEACAPGASEALVAVGHFFQDVNRRFGHAARFHAVHVALHADDGFCGAGGCGHWLGLRVIVCVLVSVVVSVIVCVVVSVVVCVVMSVCVLVSVVVRVAVLMPVVRALGMAVFMSMIMRVSVIMSARGAVLVPVVMVMTRRLALQVGKFLVQHIIGKFQRHFVENGERTNRHARLHGNVLDHSGRNPFAEQREPFIDEASEDPAGVEPARVVDDDGGLADRLYEIKSPGECVG